MKSKDSQGKIESCEECYFLEDHVGIGLWCNKLRTRIFYINVKKNLFCNYDSKDKIPLKKFIKATKRKRWSLNMIFEILGAPKEFCYPGRWANDGKKRSIYRKENGENKSEKELLSDLEYYWKKAFKKYHPDLHPTTERPYFDMEMRKINEAYQQGKKLIHHRFHYSC